MQASLSNCVNTAVRAPKLEWKVGQLRGEDHKEFHRNENSGNAGPESGQDSTRETCWSQRYGISKRNETGSSSSGMRIMIQSSFANHTLLILTFQVFLVLCSDSIQGSNLQEKTTKETSLTALALLAIKKCTVNDMSAVRGRPPYSKKATAGLLKSAY